MPIELRPFGSSLAELLTLTEYNRILYLQPTGLLLSATELDRLLAKSSKNLWTESSGQGFTPRESTPLLLLAPSRAAFDKVHDRLAAEQTPDTALLAHLLSEQNLTPPFSADKRLVLESTYLQNELQDSEIRSLPSSASYVHFSDPALLGPEYDIPRELFLREAPTDSRARIIWARWYEKFRDLRMEVCGLDLEPMPRAAVKPLAALDTDGHEGG